MSAFSDALTTERLSRRLTQKEIAEPAGYDKSFVSRLESAKRRPKREHIIYLAQAMQMTGEETDHLLVTAGFAPVQGASLLNLPELAQLDEWLGVYGDEETIQVVRDFVRRTLQTPVNPDREAMRAFAV